MSRRRATGFAVLILLVSSLLVGFSQPAGAVERELRTKYRCTATAMGGIELGSGRASSTVRVNLPRRVQVGDRLAGRDIRFRIKVPPRIVERARSLQVRAIDATSNDAYYRIKRLRKPVRDLSVPRTRVPADGPMFLVGTGRASGHTFVRTGRFPIKVPLGFTARGTAYGTPAGSVEFDLACTLVADAPERIGVIRVVR